MEAIEREMIEDADIDVAARGVTRRVTVDQNRAAFQVGGEEQVRRLAGGCRRHARGYCQRCGTIDRSFAGALAGWDGRRVARRMAAA